MHSFKEALDNIDKAKKVETSTFFYVNQLNNQQCECYVSMGKTKEGIAVREARGVDVTIMIAET